MKKGLLLAAMLAVISAGLNVRPAGAAVAASTSTAVAWPDYKAKPWVLNKEVPMVALALYSPKNNDFVLEPGKFNVRIGTVSWYFDSADPTAADLAVAEVNVLGNGPVVRRMLSREIDDVDTQVMMKGKWVSLPPRSNLLFKVTDEESVITKNQMSGVVLTVISADGKVLLELKLDNKNKKK